MKADAGGPRSTAVGVLAAVERGGRSDRVLDAALRSRPMPDRDRRLVTEITYGTLRRQATLDRSLGPFCSRPLAKLDDDVRVALRIAVYQAAFLNSVPLHAAVDTSVEIVKERRPGAAGLVNAVLRAWAREGGQIDRGRPGVIGDAVDAPAWWYERWRHAYGGAATGAWFREALRPPPFFLHPHPRVSDPGRTVDALREEGVLGALSDETPAAGIRVEEGNPLDTEPFRRGAFTPRSEAAHLVTRLLPVRVGAVVLDACSGRGGKAIQIAEASSPRVVVSVDNDARRLSDARAASLRAGAHEVTNVRADLSISVPARGHFDAILVDAPCSGLGTVRRNPEIKWRIRPRDLSRFAQLQRRILGTCIGALARGGHLLYVTCSTEPEENEEVVKSVLAERPGGDVRVAELPPDERVEGFCRGDDGFFRTFPARADLDGFFAALLVRED